MAKLGKIKFNYAGSSKGRRTTDREDIELYLYYDGDKDYFYFDVHAYRDYVNKDHLNFHDCKTKQSAVQLMSVAIFKNQEQKKFLRIKLDIRGQLNAGEEKLSKLFMEMTSACGYFPKSDQRKISISFSRVIRFGSEDNFIFATCDENWELSGENQYSKHSDNLIEWDEETEKFIMNMQAAMDQLSNKITTFFNAKDEADFKNRITNMPLLLATSVNNQ